ncbi:MAG: hypothetical protein WCG23_04735 [bacterium]
MLDLKNYKNIKAISFDIFDTAILRETFRPKDIFDIIESKYKNNFKEQRMQAENFAREKNAGECSLDDIYKIFSTITPAFSDKINEIKNYEISLEIKHSQQNKEIFDFYTSIKDNYNVIFISDMYLDKAAIKTMLINAGYGDHPIYLSGELNINKTQGELFDYVIQDLGIKYEELLHIGDNYRSDILSASKKGINTYYSINNYDKSFSNDDVKNKKIIELYDHKNYATSFLAKLLTEKEGTNADKYNKIGFYWGAVFYNFVKWVIEEADGRRILFNSRDGYLPYKIAKCIIGIDCDYVFLARRSSAFIAFDTDYPINHEKNLYFYNALRFQRVNNIKQLLGCIGLDSQKVFQKIIKAGFNNDEDNIEPFKFNGQEIHEKIQNLLLSIETEIYDNCLPKKQALLNYIESLNIKNNDVFCDIGYNGSIQYCVELLTDIKLDGKYFEVYKRNIQLDCRKEGYISNGENLTYGYGGLLETIFSAPHGGVIGYEGCEPLLFEDSWTRINILNKIHEGIIEFCVKWHKLNQKINLDIDREIIKTMVIRFLKSPSLKEAKYGLEIPFDNGSENALENITWFNESRIKSGRILECYNRSYWKEAFMQMLNNSQYSGLSKFLN